MIPWLSSLKFGVAMVAITVFLAAAAFGKWQYGRANEAERALAASETARKADLNSFNFAKSQMEAAIKTLEDRRSKDQEQMDALTKANHRIAGERDAQKAKLDGFRDRIAKVAKAKPDRLGDLATRATNRLFTSLAEASGADSNTGPDGRVEKISPAAP